MSARGRRTGPVAPPGGQSAMRRQRPRTQGRNRARRRLTAGLARLRFGAALLAVLGAWPASGQPRIGEIGEHIVVVRGFDAGGRALGDIAGFGVGEGHVVSAAAPLFDAEELRVQFPDTGDEIAAEVVSRDERSGVAVLRSDGLAAEGLTFVAVRVTPSEGDIVHLPGFAADGSLDPVIVRGSVSELHLREPTALGEREVLLFRHSVRAAVRQYGMPLLNDCGEVVGLLRTDPNLMLDERSARPEPGLAPFAVAAAAIRERLDGAGVTAGTADEPCLDPAARIRAAEARAEAARERAQAARAQAEAAEQEAEAAAAAEEAAQAEAEAAEAEREAAEAERAAAEAERDAAEEEAAAGAERTRTLGITVAVVAALALIVGLALARRLRRRGEELEDKQAALDQAITPATVSCLLEGADDAGRTYALKVTAEQLGASDGVVVGRNPAQASVVLDHPEVSRQHFRLAARDEEIVVSDLRSTNGTFVNGERLEPEAETVVEDGAGIGVGESIALRLRVSRTGS